MAATVADMEETTPVLSGVFGLGVVGLIIFAAAIIGLAVLLDRRLASLNRKLHRIESFTRRLVHTLEPSIKEKEEGEPQ